MKIILENMDRHNRFSGWVKQTSEITLRALLTVTCVCNVSFLSLGGDVVIGKTSLKVSNGASIVFPGNLKVSEGASVVNDGNASFSNTKNAELILGSLLDGSGMYSLQGSSNISVRGIGFSALKVNTAKSVFVESDLNIARELTLMSGVVDVSAGKTLKIQSTNKDAVVFDNSHSNESFVQGTLSRNTIAGVSYSFPLGSSFSGFHPFMVDGMVSPDYVSVSYQPDADDKWNSLYETSKGVRLEDIGGWKVTTGITGTTFRPYLSLFNSTGNLEGDLSLFHSADPDATPVKFSLDNNSVIASDKTHITSKLGKYVSGTFGVNILKSVLSPEGEKIPVLVNFLVANGSGRTTFEVPGIENYKQVILSVYNRFGGRIYQSSNYANDFDIQNLQQGTYFYELSLISDTEKKILVRNIIEVLRRN